MPSVLEKYSAQHHRDHCERQARAHARGDLRGGARQHDPPDPLVRRDAVRPRGLDECRLDPAHAVDRVEQDREGAEEGDERDLLDVADRVQQHDRDRQQRGRRDRSPVLDVRHRRLVTPPGEAERDAEPDARDAGDAEAESDPLEARHDMRAELREEPEVLELDEDRREARELRRVQMRRPELPADEDRDRHRDLGGDLERAVVERPLTQRPSAARGASGAPAARAPSCRGGSRRRGTPSPPRARTSGRSARTTPRSSAPARDPGSP